MSYFIVTSINMKDVNNIKVTGGDNNVFPKDYRPSFYRTDENGTALTKFIHDLAGGCIQPYKSKNNMKYLYAMLKTNEELKKYSSLEHGIWGLSMDGPEMEEVVQVFKKFLNEKDSKPEFVIRFTQGDLSEFSSAYYYKEAKYGFRYCSSERNAKKMTKKMAYYFANCHKSYGPEIIHINS